MRQIKPNNNSKIVDNINKNGDDNNFQRQISSYNHIVTYFIILAQCS